MHITCGYAVLGFPVYAEDNSTVCGSICYWALDHEFNYGDFYGPVFRADRRPRVWPINSVQFWVPGWAIGRTLKGYSSVWVHKLAGNGALEQNGQAMGCSPIITALITSLAPWCNLAKQWLERKARMFLPVWNAAF